MLFSKHPSGAPDQLELHKAALLYHKQKHTLPPMQQVQKPPVHSPEESIQQQVGVSTDTQVSIGNVFQDGISSLPVMYLPDHHLARLRELKMQRLDNFSPPIVERQDTEETTRVQRIENVVKRNSVQEYQPLKTYIIAQRTSMKISNLFRAHFHKPNIRTFSNQLSEKPPKAEIEEKAIIHIKEATKGATETKPRPPVPTHDSNSPLPAPKNSSTLNLAPRASAEQSHDYSENTIAVGEDNKNEIQCHDLESKEIDASTTKEKHKLNIGSSEANKVKLYQAWKRRILDLSGAKEVNN
ncbi:uncharacterized protein EAF01_007587 [Botrytis porri]|uniref:uncharacterized protein n=1 Tax=Botrytis porri TaxID=87229 RepID=UPI001901E652|nr:uncharacterized protein EAF01_007587 [Botrytis porri]KAF7900285.1 hypothetical protein EAF01_007587 [Botrytis porri]